MADRADPHQLAARHAQEAEQLLARRFGLIDNTLKAQAHATLAVYYATRASAEGASGERQAGRPACPDARRAG